jgi:hypothetical protein
MPSTDECVLGGVRESAIYHDRRQRPRPQNWRKQTEGLRKQKIKCRVKKLDSKPDIGKCDETVVLE